MELLMVSIVYNTIGHITVMFLISETRYCNVNGEWHDPYCLATNEFNEILNKVCLRLQYIHSIVKIIIIIIIIRHFNHQLMVY